MGSYPLIKLYKNTSHNFIFVPNDFIIFENSQSILLVSDVF